MSLGHNALGLPPSYGGREQLSDAGVDGQSLGIDVHGAPPSPDDSLTHTPIPGVQRVHVGWGNKRQDDFLPTKHVSRIVLFAVKSRRVVRSRKLSGLLSLHNSGGIEGANLQRGGSHHRYDPGSRVGQLCIPLPVKLCAWSPVVVS